MTNNLTKRTWYRNIGRSPALVVAAADASARVKQQADLVCSGIDDQKQIQLALDAKLGQVSLSVGTFNISAPMTLLAEGASLVGQGNETTLLNFSGTGACLQLGSGSAVLHRMLARDMRLHVLNDGADGVLVDSVRNAKLEDIFVQGPDVASSAGAGLRVASTRIGGNRGVVSNLRFFRMFKGIEISGVNKVNDWAVFGGQATTWLNPPIGSIGVDAQLGDTWRVYGFSIENYETHVKMAGQGFQFYGTRMERGTNGFDLQAASVDFLAVGGSISNMTSNVIDNGETSRFLQVPSIPTTWPETQTFAQPLMLPDGSPSAPAIAFASTPGHGLRRASDVQWRLVAAGEDVLMLQPGSVTPIATFRPLVGDDGQLDIGTSVHRFRDGHFARDLHAAVGRGATLVVAASDAAPLMQKQADFVCDGIDDEVQIHAAIAALPGKGTVLLSEGTFNVATVYVNDTQTELGGAIHGVVLAGMGREATTVTTSSAVAVSIGKRDIDSAAQVDGASNSIVVRDMSIDGGALELYGCQRASRVDGVRITPALPATRGLFSLFSNTLMVIGSRVDNGGNDVDGMIFDSCPDLSIMGGGANFCRYGIRFVMDHLNANRSTSVQLRSVHLEGNRRVFLDLFGIGSGSAEVHAVASSHWDSAFPVIHMHGVDASDEVRSFELRNSFINGSGAGGSVGTLVQVDRVSRVRIGHNRLANAAAGIAVGLDARDVDWGGNRFEGLTTEVTVDPAATLQPDVAELNMTVSPTPTQTEVQAIADKVDELIAALRSAS